MEVGMVVLTLCSLWISLGSVLGKLYSLNVMTHDMRITCLTRHYIEQRVKQRREFVYPKKKTTAYRAYCTSK